MDENQRAFRNEVKVLFVVVLAIIFLLSFAGKAGVIGTILSNLSFGFFGLLAYALPFFGVIAGYISVSILPMYLLIILVVMWAMHRGVLTRVAKDK